MIQSNKDLLDDLQMNAIILDHFMFDFCHDHESERNSIPLLIAYVTDEGHQGPRV